MPRSVSSVRTPSNRNRPYTPPTTSGNVRKALKLLTDVASTAASHYVSAASNTFATNTGKQHGSDLSRRMSGASRRSSLLSNSTNVTTSTTRVAGVKRGSRKSVKRVASKRVKRSARPSKKFAAKVKVALAQTMPTGDYKFITQEAVTLDPNPNIQSVFYLGANTLTTPKCFEPERVMNAASACFNNATPLVNPTVVSAGSFSSANIKILMKRSKITYTMANQTQRTLNIRLVTCAPKQIQNTAYPITQWNNALTQEVTDGINLSGINNGYLYTGPSSCAAFNKWYSTSTKTVVLEPGQVYQYTMKGPENFMYEFEKFFNGLTYQQIQKMARFVIAIVTPDLTSSTAVVHQAAHAGFPATSGMLAVEAFHHYELAMPEQTGFVYPVVVAGQSQILNNRHKAKVYLTNYGTPVTAIRVEEENPVVFEAPPL